VITDYSGNYMFSRRPVYGFEKPLKIRFIWIFFLFYLISLFLIFQPILILNHY
jgi:hypothetical protein